MTAFQALQVTEDGQRQMVSLEPTALPENHVRIEVHYSSVNYKDSLASIPKGGVIRSYPMTPGIDLSGVVLDSSDPAVTAGDTVLVTGYGLGVTHPGGYSQQQVVPSDWVVKLPADLTAEKAMFYGTAGFTAALAVEAIEQHGATPQSRILVTGASGGVGSIAIAILHSMGYSAITALSRKETAVHWLQSLGAAEVLSPDIVIPEKIKPLAKQQFDYVIDTVGGNTLSGLIPQISYGGSAALCGNASGINLSTTVLPFILRGVNLLGIDSVNTPMAKRTHLWQRFAAEWDIASHLQTQTVALAQLPETFDSLLAGTHEGRTIVKVKES